MTLANGAIELEWIESILTKLHIQPYLPPCLYYQNLNTTYFITNLIFHAQTKHVEIDFHFIHE